MALINLCHKVFKIMMGHTLKWNIINNLPEIYGGFTGCGTSYLIIWNKIGEHVLEASITTLVITFVGIVFGHYLKKGLPLLDEWLKKLGESKESE